MAQAIYREWFVEFRFPGHEGVQMVDSELGLMPQGWEVVRTEQIIKRVQSGKKYNQKTVEQIGSVPVLDQGQSGIIGYHNDVPGVIASEDEPIIVFCKPHLLPTDNPISLFCNTECASISTAA